jgi:hypothetical protein
VSVLLRKAKSRSLGFARDEIFFWWRVARLKPCPDGGALRKKQIHRAKGTRWCRGSSVKTAFGMKHLAEQRKQELVEVGVGEGRELHVAD